MLFAAPQALRKDIQRLTFEEVPCAPWGQWVLPSTYRENVQGVLPFGAQLLWDIQV